MNEAAPSSNSPGSFPPIAAPNPLPPPPRQRRWMKVAVLVGVFGAGLVIGGAVTTIVIVHRIRYAIHHPNEFPSRLAAQLKSKLSLTREQEAQVRQIFTEHQANLQRLRRDVQPKVEAELRSVQQDVGQVLDESQRAKWEALFGTLMRDWVPASPPAQP